MYHNSSLPYQWRVVSLAVRDKQGRDITSPENPIVAVLGEIDRKKKSDGSHELQLAQSILIGLEGVGKRFEIIPFYCGPKESKVLLAGTVLGIVLHQDDPDFVTIYGREGTNLWAFVCRRELLHPPCITTLVVIPHRVIASGFPCGGGLDLAAISGKKISPQSSKKTLALAPGRGRGRPLKSLVGI